LFFSQVLKIVVFSHREWQCSKHELCARQELLVVDSWNNEFNRMNLSASTLSGAPLSMVYHQIFGVVTKGTQVGEINLK
jgi:hypothetical protein